jgi:hypothetical protein
MIRTFGRLLSAGSNGFCIDHWMGCDLKLPSFPTRELT